MDISIQQLRVLREVAACQTIAAAAESLGYTPSALSQQLRNLERATGVPVHERVGRNVRLTDAGRELVGHARSLLDGLEAAQAAVERVTDEARGTLTLGTFESVAATALPTLLTRLAADHPDLRLRTAELEPDEAMASLASGDIDLSFTVDYRHAPSPPTPGIRRDTVVDEYFRLAVATDDPLTGRSVALSDLADRSFICSSPQLSCGRCIVTACRTAGFEPDIAHVNDDYSTALHLVAANQGVALIPDLGLVRRPDGVRILDTRPQFSRTIQIAYREASADRPAVVAVRALIDEVFADLAAHEHPHHTAA
jgi:DNA-binding transcriptional LysR family regulator